MAESDFDIIVIGAGLAGLAAAHEVVKGGNLSVGLVEAKEIGSNNPSPLTFADVVEAHGLGDCLKARYSAFTYHNHNGSIVKHVLPGTPLIVLDYKKACQKIHSRIASPAGQVAAINKRAAKYSQGKSVVVTFEDGHSIRGKILLDCSGRSQFTASPATRDAGYFSHVYGGVFSGVECFDTSTACFLLPSDRFGVGGGWFYPLEHGMASFGYATISTSREFNRALLVRNFQSARETFMPYSKYLKDAALEYVEHGVIPVSAVDKFVNGRIIVVGDAGGMATSWTCMGIEPALRYGAFAGRVADRAIRENNWQLLESFQEEWNATDEKKYRDFATLAPSFWKGEHYFWEWISKNDLALLSSEQILGRMRTNSHVPSRLRFFWRALRYKIRTMVDNRAGDPVDITVSR